MVGGLDESHISATYRLLMRLALTIQFFAGLIEGGGTFKDLDHMDQMVMQMHFNLPHPTDLQRRQWRNMSRIELFRRMHRMGLPITRQMGRDFITVLLSRNDADKYFDFNNRLWPCHQWMLHMVCALPSCRRSRLVSRNAKAAGLDTALVNVQWELFLADCAHLRFWSSDHWSNYVLGPDPRFATWKKIRRRGEGLMHHQPRYAWLLAGLMPYAFAQRSPPPFNLSKIYCAMCHVVGRRIPEYYVETQLQNSLTEPEADNSWTLQAVKMIWSTGEWMPLSLITTSTWRVA